MARACCHVATGRLWRAQMLAARATSAAFDGRERIAVKAHVILQPGAGMATPRNGPFVHLELRRADACGAPKRIWRVAVERFDIDIQDALIGGHGVLHAHHELHIKWAASRPSRAISAACTTCERSKAFDLGLYIVCAAFPRPTNPPDRVGFHKPGWESCSTPPRARPCPAAAAASRRAPCPRPSARRWKTARSCRGNAFPAPPSGGRISRGPSWASDHHCAHGNGRWWHPPRRLHGCFRPVRTR
jgi:hypothetical protein